ncbi:MMPL family transporter [Streptomyces sp. NPDC015131]|uniref:MMPL family transporter n=1 Tax=Streptomyces sp. NPDC015131 TaxID=3364941 RepID=UPI0036FF89F0
MRHGTVRRRPRLWPADPLGSLADLVLRFPVRVLVVAGCALLAAAAVAVGVSGTLHHGGTTAPGAEWARAEHALTTSFRGGSPTVSLVAKAPPGGSVDDPAVVAAGNRLAERARRLPRVVEVRSYWQHRAAPLRGRDGGAALVLLRVASDEASAQRYVEPLLEELTGRHGPLEVAATGATPVGLAIERQSRLDLRRTELLAAPLTAAVLVVVFGGVVAAGLALLVGVCAVVGAVAFLHGLSHLTTVSVISLNLATALGFALAVDFSLFMMARYREERTRYRGESDAAEAVHQALLATVCTTGRTVVCSALTVMAGLAALLVFPLGMLRSVAYGGIAVVGLSAVLALTALPAALLLLGPRIDALSVRRRRPLWAGRDDGRWYRLAYAVMRRPVPVALVLGALLTALVLPFAGARFGTFDDRALPAGSATRQASDTVRRDFDHHALDPVQVVLPGLDARAGAVALDGYARRLSALDRVTRVETATGTYREGRRVGAAPPGHGYASAAGSWAAVVTGAGPSTPEGTRVVREVRALSSPVPVLVGGVQAWLADLGDTIRAGLVPALSLIAVVTLLLLGWCTRSVVLPLKALVLNVLSLSASFGVMVLVFQDGWLSGLLGVTPTGVTDTVVPVLVLCVAFGLSMDYEVLLLSRTVEEHAAGAPTKAAVARAVQRTAGLFTASALVVVVVMAALAASGLLLLKVVGVGLAVAVLVDATVIRLLLAPALMALLGRANWWVPALRPAAQSLVPTKR